MRLVLPVCALFLVAPVAAGAQAANDGPQRSADRLLGGWVAASVAPSSRFGPITDRHYFAAALRAQYLLETIGPVAIASTFDVVPLALLSNTPEYEMVSAPGGRGMTAGSKTVTGRSPVFGAGFVPAGLKIYTRATRPARLFIAGSAGVLWFTRDTPVPDTRRFNFAMETGAGAELVSHSGRVTIVGYKYQHLSNGGTAQLNPGFDAHLVYVGVMRPRGGRRNGHDAPMVGR